MTRENGEHANVGQLYTVAKAVIGPVFKFSFRVFLSGLDRVPAEGGAIIAPNHTSVIDSFIVPSVLPRRITYVGKAEYMDSWKTKYLFPAMGMIPIDRAGGEASKRALDAAAGVLERGQLFGIYPEGTRARDGKLHKGHTGVARLALRTGSPIVPVGIKGTREMQPPDASMPKLFSVCEINFGKPIDVTRYLGRESDHLLLRQITDEVMYEIRELAGAEYEDTYATKKAETMPTDTAVVPPTPPTSDAVLDVTDAAGAGANGSKETARRSSADVLSRRN